MAKVKQLYGDIPNHPMPEHPPVNLAPVKPETFTLDSNLPYVLGFIAYRMPGTDSPDYAAAQILSDMLASQRGDIYGMVPAGKALYASFGVAENYPKASVGYGEMALPAGADATGPINEMRQIIEGLCAEGLAPGPFRRCQAQRDCLRRVSAQLHPRLGFGVVGGAYRRRPQFSRRRYPGDPRGHPGGCEPGGQTVPGEQRTPSPRP
jgi:hypothetical protein